MNMLTFILVPEYFVGVSLLSACGFRRLKLVVSSYSNGEFQSLQRDHKDLFLF